MGHCGGIDTIKMQIWQCGMGKWEMDDAPVVNMYLT